MYYVRYQDYTKITGDPPLFCKEFGVAFAKS